MYSAVHACLLTHLALLQGLQATSTVVDVGDGSPQNASPIISNESWRERLLQGYRQRESTARDLRIAFMEYRGESPDSLRVGSVVQGGAYEKWATFEVPWKPDGQIDATSPLDVFNSNIGEAKAQIHVFDGAEHLALLPVSKTDSGLILLEGSLSVGGVLNSGHAWRWSDGG